MPRWHALRRSPDASRDYMRGGIDMNGTDNMKSGWLGTEWCGEGRPLRRVIGSLVCLMAIFVCTVALGEESARLK